MKELSLDTRALEILRARYLLRDPLTNQLIEEPPQLFLRVAQSVAEAEQKWGGIAQEKAYGEQFYEMMSQLEFLPNSPTLMNAGTPLGQLSACFVIPIEDNLGGIFDSLKLMALIQQSGGGTGFSFSRLRKKGDPVSLASGVASGPVSFMRIFDTATENIRQGGKRRGANMGILRVDHPDIKEFVRSKLEPRQFENFNLSVGITHAFMEAVEKDTDFTLIDPWNHQASGKVRARNLLQLIAECAWTTGDPGLVFLDTINQSHPTPALGEIEATNPCGEVPLLPFEACNLGSINLTKVLKQNAGKTELDWKKLEQLILLSIRFLDNVIEVSKWPSELVTQQVLGNRKIGLGIMGFAEVLMMMDIPYDSPVAVSMAEHLMKFVSEKAWSASEDLAQERGVFPHWNQSIFKNKNHKVRNATVTSIAPTGTISMIAGTSSGIEPLFGLAYTQKNILDGKSFSVLNPVFERLAKEKGWLKQEEIEEVRRKGVFPRNPALRTALEIKPESHLAIQEAFQKYTDNAVSKTINLSREAQVDDVFQVYFQAWKKNLKGITVFRDGCKTQQVFELGQACQTPDCRL